MTLVFNRQIKTDGGNEQSQPKITLKVLADNAVLGRDLKKGDTITVDSKSEARRLMATHRNFFTVAID